MKIKSIRSSNAKGYLIVGIVHDGAYESYTVSEGQYISLGSPCVGDSLDEGLFRELSDFAAYNFAKKKALGILSYGDNSIRSLISKLMRAGVRRALASAIASEMVSLGYINEDRQLERLVTLEVNERACGPRKLMARLTAKGYAPDRVRRAVAALEAAGEISFARLRRELLATLPEGSEYSEVQKILYKHGF